MDVHPSGYYAWKKQPLSDKVRDDQRLLGLLKQAWLESGCVYGYRKLTLDMRDLGERCGKHRVARLEMDVVDLPANGQDLQFADLRHFLHRDRKSVV